MTVALSSLIAAAVGFGAFRGTVKSRLDNADKVAQEIKENYLTRFDRLDKKLDAILDKMDGFMTKEDHDRICQFKTEERRQPRRRK